MRIPNAWRILTTCLLLSGLLIEYAQGQSWPESQTNSVGIHAGVFWPVGDWTRHPYAQGVDQFQWGPAFGLEIEHRVSNTLGLAVAGGYAVLDAGDWEEYARSQGDDLEASAHMFHVGAALKIYLVSGGENNLKLAFGVSYFSSDGQESFNGLVYDYDFFSIRSVAFLAGIEFEHFLSDRISISARVDGIAVPSGMQYADGREYSVFGFPTTLGMRFYF